LQVKREKSAYFINYAKLKGVSGGKGVKQIGVGRF